MRLNKRFRYSCFPINFANFLRTPFQQTRLAQQTFFVFQEVLKTSWRRLQRLRDVFKTYLQYVFLKCLQDVFKTFLRRLPRRLQDVFAIRLPIMSSRRLQDVLKTSWKTKKCYTEDVFKMFSRRLQYVFSKTNVCWEAIASGLNVLAKIWNQNSSI